MQIDSAIRPNTTQSDAMIEKTILEVVVVDCVAVSTNVELEVVRVGLVVSSVVFEAVVSSVVVEAVVLLGGAIVVVIARCGVVGINVADLGVVCWDVGGGVGGGVGDTVGDSLCDTDGDTLGDADGDALGDTVGNALGDTVDNALGDALGDTVGDTDGVATQLVLFTFSFKASIDPTKSKLPLSQTMEIELKFPANTSLVNVTLGYIVIAARASHPDISRGKMNRNEDGSDNPCKFGQGQTPET